jgi:FixJ family two-component response regulator
VAESEWVGVVDDDASIRCSLVRVFRSNGIRAETFSSAEAYLERTVAGEPRCIVLDVHLGALSGFDLQDLLTAAGRAPPIIFITAHDNFPAERLAPCGDALGYLRKPFDTDTLVALVRRHLQQDSRRGSDRL